MADVFISYSRKDKDFVSRLHEALEQRELQVWIDWEDIPPTADWLAEVFRGIEASDSFVFVMSPDSIASEVCAREIESAVDQGKRIVPLVRRDAGDKAIPAPLASRNWIFFRTEDDFDTAFETLVQALDTDLEWVRAHTRLLIRAREWEENGRDGSLLLRGSDLNSAEQWLMGQSAEAEPKPTMLHSSYVSASRKQAAVRQKQVVAAVTSALVITIALGLLALTQRNTARAQARLALSRQLAADAAGVRDDGMDLALLLAATSYKTLDTSEARASLLQTLVSSPRLAGFIHGGKDATSIDFSPDGRTLAVGGRSGAVTMWDIRTRKQGPRRAKSGSSAVTTLTYSPDGKWLAWATEDGSLMLEKLGGASPQQTLLQPKGSPVRSLAFNPAGSLLAAGDDDQSLTVWDAQKAVLLETLDAQSAGGSNDLAFSSDGLTLIAASGQGQIAHWDLTQDPPQATETFAGGGQPLSSAYSPDMTKFAGFVLGAGVPYINDAIAADSVLENSMAGPSVDIRAMEFSPDGSVLAAAGEGRVVLWDVNEGRARQDVLSGYPGTPTGLSFSPDGRRLALINSYGSIVLWDLTASPSLATRLKVPGSQRPDELPNVIRGASAAAFSPDGRTLAWSVVTSEVQAVVIWDLKQNKEVRRLPAEDAISLSFSSDGRKLATRAFKGDSKQGFTIWDLATGKSQGPGTLPWKVQAEASESKDPWAARSSRGIGASVGFDGTLTFWDQKRRAPLGSLPVAGAVAESKLVFSPNGQTLAVADPGGGVTRIDMSLNSWVNRACSISGRNLTEAEKTQYVGSEFKVPQACPAPE